jgi:hypothetical protein
MMVGVTRLPVSELDGEDPGGFVVVNVEAPFRNPFQVLEESGGGYLATLSEARTACLRWREESGNDMIFVYALVGVREAIAARPDCFPFE